MKKLTALLMFLSVAGLVAGPIGGVYQNPTSPAMTSDPGMTAARQAEQQQRALAAARLQGYALVFSQDPWREIGGIKQPVSPTDWVVFSGKVLEVQPDGIRVQGRFFSLDEETDYNGEFFVASYPWQVAEDETVPLHTAKLSGVKTYTTVMGGSRTIRNLDYGIACDSPPLTPEQIAAAKAAAEAAKTAETNRKKAAADAGLKWNEEQADNGDAYGQLRMGERYRDGNGVEKDLVKARSYFQKSAAQGNKDAADALNKLSSN